MTVTHFLYTIRPTRGEMLISGPSEREAGILSQHFNYLEALTQNGKVLMAGRTLTTGPESVGLVIINSTDEAAAQAVMDNDPAVAEGVMAAVLVPFRISLVNPAGLDST